MAIWNIRPVPDELHRIVKTQAAAEGITIREFVLRAAAASTIKVKAGTGVFDSLSNGQLVRKGADEATGEGPDEVPSAGSSAHRGGNGPKSGQRRADRGAGQPAPTNPSKTDAVASKIGHATNCSCVRCKPPKKESK